MNYKLFLFAIPLCLIGCYSTNFTIHHYDPVYSFREDGKQFAYSLSDSIIVSLGIADKIEKDFVLDLTLDNPTDSAITFDPQDIYIFCYSNDSKLHSNLSYHPVNPKRMLDSLDQKIVAQKKKINRNTGFGILFGLLYAAGEVASIGSDNQEAKQDLRDSHGEMQATLSANKEDANHMIGHLEFQKKYWKHGVMNKITVEGGKAARGLIHIRIPYSPQYRLYVPVNNRTHRFAFKAIKPF